MLYLKNEFRNRADILDADSGAVIFGLTDNAGGQLQSHLFKVQLYKSFQNIRILAFNKCQISLKSKSNNGSFNPLVPGVH